MSEDNITQENVPLQVEAKHKSVSRKMMKKADDMLGDILAKRDMNPSLWIRDVANTAGFLTIIYGIHALTNETTPNPAFHNILNAVSGKPEIVVAADLTKRVLDINSKVNTAANTHNLIDNFYLAKAYVGDFLKHVTINKTQSTK